MRTLFVILSSVLKNKQGPDRKTDNLTYSGLNCRGKVSIYTLPIIIQFSFKIPKVAPKEICLLDIRFQQYKIIDDVYLVLCHKSPDFN